MVTTSFTFKPADHPVTGSFQKYPLEPAFGGPVGRVQDNVNSPAHYNLNEHGIECIQAIEASMSKEEFQGYLKGNIIKYLWRYKNKGKAKEDLEKAAWYLNKLKGTL